MRLDSVKFISICGNQAYLLPGLVCNVRCAEYHRDKKGFFAPMDKAGTAAESIVVDDVSKDGSLDTLKLFPRARAVVREVNGGFSRACNTGIAVAKWKILILPQFRR